MRDFVWGTSQWKAFERIKDYLTRPPVLQAPKIRRAFMLYVAASERVLGVVLTQDAIGKEGVIAYLSRRVLDADAWHTHVERLCLALYYTSSKFQAPTVFVVQLLHGGKPI
jgi:hypothetical protein